MQFGTQLVGFGQRHGRCAFFGVVSPPDVKTDVYRIGFYPQRVAQVQGYEHQFAAENRGQVQTLGNVLGDLLVKAALKACRQLAQVERAHVHGHLGRLQV